MTSSRATNQRKSLVAGAVLLVVGLAVEAVAAPDGRARDLATGLVVGVAGLVVVRRRSRDPVGWLLLGGALAWFLGTLTAASGWLAEVGEQSLFAHRGFLLAALVAPLWRAGVTQRQTTVWLTVAAIATSSAVLISVGTGAGSATALAIVATATIGAAFAGAVLGVPVPWRAMWLAAIGATVVWCAAASTLRSVEALTPDDRLLAYQVGIAAAAIFMAASRFDRRPVVEQVVEVGRREGLGGALGDPRLRIGFGDGATFRAVDGSAVVASASQQSTVLDLRDEGRAAQVLIVHRPGLLDDPLMRADVEAAAHLLADHHRLIDEVEQHAASVEASRARVLASEQRAVAGFAEDLEQRVLVHLDGLLDALDSPREEAARVRAVAAEIRAELTELAAGYAPVACADLPAAISSMVESFPVPVRLDLRSVPVDEACGRVLYFVAAEALSNVLKHSRASSVDVCLRTVDGCVELRVEDDGTGDVNARPGGGLAGLGDRVSVAGGSLDFRRRVPQGTAVVARLPVPLPDSHLRDTSCVRRRGWRAWTVDAVALAAAIAVLVAVGDRWSLTYSRSELMLAWVLVVAAAVVVFAGAVGGRPPRAFGAGIVALIFVIPALAVLDEALPFGVLAIALGAALPLAVAAFAARVIRLPGRYVMGALTAATAFDVVAQTLLRDPSLDPRCAPYCGGNPLLVSHRPGVTLLADRVLAVVVVAWCAVALSQIVAARSQAPAARVAAALAVAGVAAATASWPSVVVVALVPAFVLAAAPDVLTWRSRLRVRTLASDLSAGFERDGVAGHLQRAMADPSVRLAFPVESGDYIDSGGMPTELTRHRATTVLARNGEPIAVVEHSPSSSSLIEAAVNPAVTIAAENERLHAEAQAHLAELQASRRRIVERADETRRHLERDLHDGAQQQLLLLGLELARTAEAADDGQRDRYLGALQHAQSALTELRRLVHDQLPPVLDELGLVEALRTLAEASPVPLVLAVDTAPAVRPDLAVERVVYGVALSSLSEAQAHGASAMSIGIEDRAGRFTVTVRHDGVDAADHTDVEDRVGALGGRLDVLPVDGGVSYVASFP